MRTIFSKLDSATDLIYLAVIVATGALVLLSIYPDVQYRSNNFYLMMTEHHCVHDGERFLSVFLVGDDGEFRRPVEGEDGGKVNAECGLGQQKLYGLRQNDVVTNEYGTRLKGVLDDSGIFAYAEGYTPDTPILPSMARPVYRFLVSLIPVVLVVVTLVGMGTRAMHAIYLRNQSDNGERMHSVYSVLTPLLLSAVVVGMLSLAEVELTTAGTMSLMVLPLIVLTLAALEVRADIVKIKELMDRHALKGA